MKKLYIMLALCMTLPQLAFAKSSHKSHRCLSLLSRDRSSRTFAGKCLLVGKGIGAGSIACILAGYCGMMSTTPREGGVRSVLNSKDNNFMHKAGAVSIVLGALYLAKTAGQSSFNALQELLSG